LLGWLSAPVAIQGTKPMETFEGTPTFSAKSRAQWREWLSEHCESEGRIWLILYHTGSSTPSVHFQEAIEEAICFGWIDSRGKKRGPDSFYLCFNKRNPRSTWGTRSRERAERMVRAGLMTSHGQRMIDLAKQSGTWDEHADAQNLVMPADFQRLLDLDPTAKGNFQRFAPSSKRIVLEWISKAKRIETRQKRIGQAVELAASNKIGGLPKGMNDSRSRQSESTRKGRT
jgi:uncharacterized protein YdeI (YjbR/CyaY-like superfamily)